VDNNLNAPSTFPVYDTKKVNSCHIRLMITQV
jgi:hypothetical protein